MTNCQDSAAVRPDRDEELVNALREQEPGAAERLVMAYQARAYRLAIGITGSAEDAEEVVQDAFLTVIRKIDTFRQESSFGSWLYRIVSNGACQKLRRKRSQRLEIPLEEVLPPFDEAGRHAASVVDWSAAVDDHSRRMDVRAALTSAIEELPAHYRAVLVLRDIEGWACTEIALTLGLSVGNVRARVHRARLFLRKRLAHCLSGAEAPLPSVTCPDGRGGR
jgi:RNA polymerase sigma-70 factor, ECF subfamily